MHLHNCRSFSWLAVAISVGMALSSCASPEGAGTSAESSEIGYATVAEAFDALNAKTGETFSLTRPDGWLLVLERGKPSQWLFTPSGHYAHPAVVHRVMSTDRDGTAYFETSVLCQAEKSACDRLLTEMAQANEHLRQVVTKQLQELTGK